MCVITSTSTEPCDCVEKDLRSDEARNLDSLEVSLSALEASLSAFELDGYTEPIDYEDTTIVDIHQTIETNLWLGDAYTAQGAPGLAAECYRAAQAEWTRFEPLLLIYAGPTFAARVKNAVAS